MIRQHAPTRRLGQGLFFGAATAALFAAALPVFAEEPVGLGNSPVPAAQEETPKPSADGAKKDDAKKTEEAPQVTGRVLFEGELPAVKPLEISSGAAVGCCPAGETVDDEDYALQISKERGIRNVVVTVKVEGVKVEVPEEPFIMDQKGCRFIPHVQVIPKGATVEFLNSDEASHNVHLITMANDALNQTVISGKKLLHEFKEAEEVKVTCDMHTWMVGHIVVTDATHYTLTDENGAFSLSGLPPGTHEVSFWHETLKRTKGTVVVAEDGTVEKPLEATFKKAAKKKRRRRR